MDKTLPYFPKAHKSIIFFSALAFIIYLAVHLANQVAFILKNNITYKSFLKE